MIGNTTGGKNDVIVQWLPRKYLIDGSNEARDIPVGPDEYAIIIKEGKVAEVATETQISAKPGYWRRFWDWAKETKDVQVIIVDTRKHEISIPFEAFTSDRVPIRGKVDLFANISKDNTVNAIRLLKEEGIASDISPGEKYGTRRNEKYDDDILREITTAGLAAFLKRNTQYIVDTEGISNYKAEEIQKDRTGICTDIISALNSKTPYWVNYGLSVRYSGITIDDNEYERLERRDRERTLEERLRDIEFAARSSESEDRIRTADLANREKASLELNEYLSARNLEALETDRPLELAHEAALTRMDREEQEATRGFEKESRLELLSIYHQREKNRIRDEDDISDEEKKVKIAEIDQRLGQIQNQIKDEEYQLQIDLERRRDELENERREFDLEMEQKRKRFDAELEMERKQKDADILNQISKREDDLNEKREDYRHQETVAAGQNDVRKTEIQSGAQVEMAKAQASIDIQNAKAEAAGAVGELRGYKEANDTAHRQSMDNLNMTERIVRASAGSAPAPAPAKEDVVYCPNCNTAVRPGARFCTNCGAKLRGDERWDGSLTGRPGGSRPLRRWRRTLGRS